MLCRLCLFEIISENAFDFSDETCEDAYRIAKFIAKQLELVPFQDSEDSKKICQDCYGKINSFYTFCEFIQERQKILLDDTSLVQEISSKSTATLQPNFENDLEVVEKLKSLEDFAGDNKEFTNTTPEELLLLGNNVEALLDIKDVLSDNDADKTKPLIEVDGLEYNKSGYLEDHDHHDESKASEGDEDEDDLETIKTLIDEFENGEIEIKKDNDISNTNSPVSKQIKPRKGKTKKKRTTVIHTKRENLTEKPRKYEDFIAKHLSLKCDICDMSMESFNGLNTHFTQVHNMVGYLTCCEKRFTYKHRIDLVTHIKLHLDPNAFKCKICGKILTSAKCLEIHNRNKHVDKQKLRFTCNICGRKFAHANNMSSHTLTHLDKKEFMCEICNKGFKTKRSLFVHNKSMHTGIKPFICDTCGKDFKCKASFERHIAEHLGNYKKQPAQQCTICGKWLMKDGLRKHMDTHNTVEVECKECGKRLCSKSALVAHVKYMHSLKSMLKCTFCEKTFKRQSNLKEHIAIHTGTKDYKCFHCEREFRSKANMYVHIKRDHFEEWKSAQEKRFSSHD